MGNTEISKVGLKITLPRIKILETLQGLDQRHITAEGMYKLLLERGEEIGLATVYRVLTQFVSAGLVERHHFEGAQAVFELNRGAHHDHIVCQQCGHVEEFYDETIEQQQHKVAKSQGFEINDHALILYARCTKENCSYLDIDEQEQNQ